ncbi:ATP-grasp domain-containing protein [Clostridium sp. SYSU_GA19001]|uniref:ATP-grasp domain-containing protein n=1 Tax=Clostridium caldaquaticum TaxID=2940653 RepID=UPI002077226F|nr:ATP-grasp domain-containing protein [Clostridium caldaquaticum]MCM8711680.1 ATP-grasp domain-containing protein [Clostridium caldaquaticum]
MDLKVLWTISKSMGTVSDIEMLKQAKAFNINVITTDVDDADACGFLITGKKYILPKVKDSKYIDSMIDVCRCENVTTIIPQYSDELILISENIHRFNNLGIKVLVTEDIEKLKIANNKVNLYNFFKNEDFIPKYIPISSIDSIKDAAFQLGYPNVPVCIKPVNGEGGKGFRIITAEKVNIFSDSSAALKIDLPSYLNQIKKIDKIPQLIVSEYLPGKEYSVDCVCKNGITYICITRQRVETTLGVATVSIIEKNDKIIQYSKKIISALNLSYNINLQFKYSKEGHPKLIEVNPRVSGSLVANYGALVNMLESSLKLAYNMPLEEPTIKWGTKMIRYWSQIFQNNEGI